jgi:diguanylate cyclase (GGDEF)-like protein
MRTWADPHPRAGPARYAWIGHCALFRPGINPHLPHSLLPRAVKRNVGLGDARSEDPEVLKAVRLGIWTSLAAAVILTVIRWLPGVKHLSMPVYLSILVPSLLIVAAVALLPKRHFRGRSAYHLLYAWAIIDVGFVTLLVGLTGGGHSELYLLYALTSLFVTSCYPPVGQLAVGAVTAAAYASVLAATGWHISPATLFLRASILALVAITAGSIAAEKDRNAKESDRRASLLVAVASVAREVNILDASDVFDAVIDVICELGMTAGHVSLIDDVSGTYRMINARGIPREYLEARPQASEGIVGLVRQARATVSLDQDQAKDYIVPVTSQTGLTAVMGSPLWVDGELAGVLAGATRAKHHFGPEDVEAFELLAGVASRALEGARRYQQMAESEARTRHQASHDELTGLANRRLLNGLLGEALARPEGHGERLVALVLVDLDDFKVVNDTLGHGAGDQMLVTVAARLLSCVRETDTVARLSGDEFVILVRGLDSDGLDHLARRLLEEVSVPYDVDGHCVTIAASIGIAMEPVATVASAALEAAGVELLSNADVAMYEAKREGKGCYVVFDQTMRDRMKRRVAIEAALPGAIERGEMTVYYQPIFDLASSCITGSEALLRWAHPTLGAVPPLEFIPLAEESGTIISIGEWVLGQACRELGALHCEDVTWSVLTMSVNLSPRQLRDPRLVDQVVRTLETTQVPPRQLTLEITESTLLQDAVSSRAKLSALANLGIQIALDDFGTGYSSLAYLQQLQVHSLKIDKSFVDNVEGLDGERTARALVRSVVELASALGLNTVAEGVETQAQVAELRRLGCRLGQGYVFSPAVDPVKLRALLRDHGPIVPAGASDGFATYHG